MSEMPAGDIRDDSWNDDMSKIGDEPPPVKTLLQLALDEMRNVIEAVNEQHETKRWPLKYGTSYGAINGMIKVREDILVQAATWGVGLSPHRTPLPPDPVAETAQTVLRHTTTLNWERAAKVFQIDQAVLVSIIQRAAGEGS